MNLDFSKCKTSEDVNKVFGKNKKLLKTLKDFKKLNQEMADKYNCKVSISFEGKETVIAEPKEDKSNV